MADLFELRGEASQAFAYHLGTKARERHGSIEAATRAYRADPRVVAFLDAVAAAHPRVVASLGYLADCDGFPAEARSR